MARVHGLGPGRRRARCPRPMAHISGLLNGVLVPGAAGLRSVLVRRFDPEQALALVARERISFLAGPPTFFIAMARALAEGPGVDVSSVRLVSSGGASVTPAFVEDTARTFDCRVKRTYGSTEAPTVTTSTDDDPFEKARDTDGRAVGAVELRVSDPGDGRRAADGHARASSGSAGPRCSPATPTPTRPRAVIARGGWFRTGDLATVDADGWVRIVGRLKDVIIRGGENISASEVEAALEAHPDVRHAVAVGLSRPAHGRAGGRLRRVRPRRSTSRSAGAGSPAAAWRRSRRPRRSSASITCRCSVRARPTGPRCGAVPPPPEPRRRRPSAAARGTPSAGSAELASDACLAATSIPLCSWPSSAVADARLRRAGRVVGAERRHARRAERVDARPSAPPPGRPRSPWTSSTPSRPGREPGRSARCAWSGTSHRTTWPSTRSSDRDEAASASSTRRPSPARSARTPPSSAARRRGPPSGSAYTRTESLADYSARVPRTSGSVLRATARRPCTGRCTSGRPSGRATSSASG